MLVPASLQNQQSVLTSSSPIDLHLLACFYCPALIDTSPTPCDLEKELLGLLLVVFLLLQASCKITAAAANSRHFAERATDGQYVVAGSFSSQQKWKICQQHAPGGMAFVSASGRLYRSAPPDAARQHGSRRREKYRPSRTVRSLKGQYRV